MRDAGLRVYALMSSPIEPEARQPSLLVIDDQAENIRLLLRILNNAGYTGDDSGTDDTGDHTKRVGLKRIERDSLRSGGGGRAQPNRPASSRRLAAARRPDRAGQSITSSSAPLM